MIVLVPEETPVATPVVEIIVATVVVPLDQVPPEVRSVSAVVNPAQTERAPLIAAGNGFTVTTMLR